jgi:hypothetical protein
MRTRIVAVAALLILSAVCAPAATALGLLPAQTPTTTPAVTTTTPTTTPTTTTPTTAPTTTSRPTTSTSTTIPTTTTSSTTSTTTPATTTTTTGSSGVSGKTIALIVLAVIAALLVGLLVVLILRRRNRAQWQTEARGAVAEASGLAGVVSQGLASLEEPAFAARTWSDVDLRGARLHSQLQGLAARAPDEQAGAVVGGMDHDLQSLRSALDADRALRLGPPPPTAEQLGYSAAVVRQRLADFEQSLGSLEDRVRQRP